MLKIFLLFFLMVTSTPGWGALRCDDGGNLYDHFVEYREKLLLEWLGTDDFSFYFSGKLTESFLSKVAASGNYRDIGAAIDGYYYAVREGSSIRVVFQSSVEVLKPKKRLDLVLMAYTDFMLGKLREGGEKYLTKVKVEYVCEKGSWKIVGFGYDSRNEIEDKLDSGDVIDVFITRQEYQGVSWAWFVDNVIEQSGGQFGWD